VPQLGITGVTLHSPRCAWAERAKTAGYPERFAQEALGHNSKAAHRADAKRALMKSPSLEDHEQQAAAKVESAVRMLQASESFVMNSALNKASGGGNFLTVLTELCKSALPLRMECLAGRNGVLQYTDGPLYNPGGVNAYGRKPKLPNSSDATVLALAWRPRGSGCFGCDDSRLLAS
jgi:hypothetical protein